MSDNPSRSRGYLNDLGTRLQTFFGFEGEANAKMETTAIPVLIIGDASQPGYGAAQLRRFVFTHPNVLANDCLFLRTQADYIIERITVRRTIAAGTVDVYAALYVTGSQSTLGPVVGFNFGMFLDRCLNIADQPRLFAAMLGGPAVVVGGREIGSGIIPIANNETLDLLGSPFMLSENMVIQVAASGGAADALSVSIWGRSP